MTAIALEWGPALQESLALSHDAVIAANSARQVVFCNAAAERLFGYPRAQIEGRPLEFLFAESGALLDTLGLRDFARFRADAAAPGQPLTGRDHNGRRIPLEVNFTKARSPGAALYLLAVRDVTQLLESQALRTRDAILSAVARASQRLLQSAGGDAEINALLRDLGEAMRVSRVVLFWRDAADAGDLRLSMTHEWCAPRVAPEKDRPVVQHMDPQALGFGEWALRLAQGQCVQADVACLSEPMREVLAGLEVQALLMAPVLVGGQLAGVLSFKDCLGPRVWHAHETSALESAAGILGAASELASAHRELNQLAYRDYLTGLPNRALFEDRLDQALARALRRPSQVALLYVDLDGFKAVNDHHGHACGDELLGAVGARLQDGLREADTVARIGGDEFAIILEDIASPELAKTMCVRVRRLFDQPFTVDDHSITLGASVGLALYPQDADSVRALREAADQALYRSKSGGH
jgi:diguanylate cyclase (GGDEF)-like protein/PAS domain S-box-containing protein